VNKRGLATIIEPAFGCQVLLRQRCRIVLGRRRRGHRKGKQGRYQGRE
jgi:hypothetical protein